LQDSGSMTRVMGSGRRHSACSDASPVFTRYSTNIKQDMMWAVYMCLFQISCGMFLPKISKIGWNLTKMSQK